MPGQQQYPQQQYPQQPYPQQQYPQQAQQMPQQPYPQQNANVSMGQMLQWAGLGGAASGAIQLAFAVITGFDMVSFAMTFGIAVIIGILVAIILGQFGKQIPLQGSLMVKAAAVMFPINLVLGFLFGMGVGALGTILGIVGIGAGSFAYGWLVQKKLPGLI